VGVVELLGDDAHNYRSCQRQIPGNTAGVTKEECHFAGSSPRGTKDFLFRRFYG
jgi:hypothetical protein